MLNKIAGQAKQRKLLVAGVVALSLIIGLLCIEYERYAYAVAWHCVHGNYAKIAGHRVRLPLLWWKEDAHAYDTTLLVRACPANTYLKPEIVVSPTISGEMGDTNQEELKSAQTVISLKNHNSIAGPSLSLVTLTSRPFTLYCVKEEAAPYGIALYANLSCHAANVPYSFTYDGHPMHEKDVELILSTIE